MPKLDDINTQLQALQTQYPSIQIDRKTHVLILKEIPGSNTKLFEQAHKIMDSFDRKDDLELIPIQEKGRIILQHPPTPKDTALKNVLKRANIDLSTTALVGFGDNPETDGPMAQYILDQNGIFISVGEDIRHSNNTRHLSLPTPVHVSYLLQELCNRL